MLNIIILIIHDVEHYYYSYCFSGGCFIICI